MSDGQCDDAEKRANRAEYMREYRKKNQEKYKEIDRKKAEVAKAKDPEKFRQHANERSKRYWHRRKASETPEQREKRLAAHRERCKKWKENGGERAKQIINENTKRYQARYPEKQKNTAHRRRCKIEAGDVTRKDWMEIVASFHGRCAYCRKKPEGRKNLSMDHVIPLSKNGPHDPTNVVPACMPCNLKKHAKEWPRPVPMTEEEFAAVIESETIQQDCFPVGLDHDTTP